MKRFRTLFLHIGLGKTGTTSIQGDILRHVRWLESSCDLHYPVDFPHERQFRGNHSLPLRVMFSSQEAVRRRLAARGLVGEEAIADYNRQTRSCLEKSFAGSNASRLLLSAEGVGHFSRQDMQSLAQWLQGYADEIRVVACLLHPAHALSSEIQQRLNIGETLDQLYQNPPLYRFRSLCRRVEEAFGEEALLVYDFAEAVKHPGGVTAALFEQIGIETGGRLVKGPPANTSMSHEAALLISALNARRPVLVDGRPNPARRGNALQRLAKIPGRKYAAPREVYDKVAAEVQDDLEWLQASYQLTLKAEYPAPQAAHDSFSEESITALALQVADQALLRHRLVAPLRWTALRARGLWYRLARRQPLKANRP